MNGPGYPLISNSQFHGPFPVSDSCSNGDAIDTSGPKIRELVAEHFTCVSHIEYKIVPDDLATIEVSIAMVFPHDL